VKAAMAVQSEPSDQALVFAAIVRFLARTGRVVEAPRIALAVDTDALRGGALTLATEPSPLVDINFDPDRHSELGTIRQAKAGGHIAEAVETARTVERQEGVLYTVAVSLCDAGNAKAALQLAQTMAPGDRPQAMAPREGLHVPALLKIAHTLRDAGADAEAASALREVLNVITAEPNQYRVPDELVSLSYALPD